MIRVPVMLQAPSLVLDFCAWCNCQDPAHVHLVLVIIIYLDMKSPPRGTLLSSAAQFALEGRPGGIFSQYY